MGEVVCFETREILSDHAPVDRGDTITVLESIYQRRHQFESVIVIGISKITDIPLFLCSADEYERRLLWTYFMDYMRDMSEDIEGD